MDNNTVINQVNSLDWECLGSDTQYLTHSIHRYSGKFIPQIGAQAISILTKPGDLIVDPYCGSGTVLLESSLAGRRSIGVDLNPLAVLISKVKTTPIAKATLEHFIESMEFRTNPLLGNPRLDRFNESLNRVEYLSQISRQDPRWDDPWYRKWFQDNVLSELILIHKQILSEQDENCKNIALVAFSDILRKCSNAGQSYPNVMFDKDRGRPPVATLEYIKKLKQISQSISELESHLNGNPMPQVVCGKAQNTNIGDSLVDAVITHPPYIGSIPYAEYGMLSLVWLGHNPKILDEQLTGGKRQSNNVVQRFESDFNGFFKESLRILKLGSFLFMLLGNPVVRGNRIDLVHMAKNIGSSVGFQLIVERQRKGINRRANLMSPETLLFFKKI